ncbi:MFS transporter [Alicyclobacillus cycloheptanicus]|uniref:MFS family arabinose efflux permease n=1 Tax=Alicyclobacillus cycloheptanicus TaxID=1457 RepID=A0ABT9XLM3_9BACL|nr:MFS transporter [Alicyclobacillus cycloheptanicus]MDQ0191212.1 putative MFS family arabinose efflux permease [Alicyclobacillus cycloheptanicus]WDM02123.1 MFS transporter [Alicyclobacillus cycloheptanicus]
MRQGDGSADGVSAGEAGGVRRGEAGGTVQPDRGAQEKSRWSLIFGFALVTAATQVLWVTFTPMTTQTAQWYHVSAGAVGWLSEVFPLLYVVLALPFGVLTDRWFRGSLAVGATLTLAGALVRILPSFTWALVGQIVVSVGQPLVINAINKTAARYVAPNQRPTAIAVGSASMFLGIFIAMLSGPLLLPLGMPVVLWSQGLFAVVGGVWLLWALRTRPTYGEPVQNEVETPNGEPARERAGIRQVFADASIRTLCLLLFVGFGWFIAVTTWLQVLVAGHGVGDVQVGIALAIMTAAGIAGAGALPAWAIRTGRSRLVVQFSLAFAVASLLAIWVGRPFWLMTLLLAAAGFLLLADLPIVLSTVEIHCPPNQVGTASGLLLLFGNLGGIVLALLVQVLVGSPHVAIGVLVMVSLLAIPLARRFPLVSAVTRADAGGVRGPDGQGGTDGPGGPA